MEKIKLNINLNLDLVLCSGQAFNWIKSTDNSYYGIFSDRIIKIKQKDNFIFWKDSLGCDEKFTLNLFNTSINHYQIIANLQKYSELKNYINYLGNLIILKQPLEETIISFVISQNNNIKRIKKIIYQMCDYFGETVFFEGRKFKLFPSLHKISNVSDKELKNLGLGYRSRYILELSKNIDKIESLKSIQNIEDQRKILLNIKGIGPKVCDCILVFGLGQRNITPIDTWVKKYLKLNYNLSGNYTKLSFFLSDKYSNLTAYAGQYIFEYVRRNNI